MLNWKLYQENFKESIKSMIKVDYEADADCRGLVDSLGVKKKKTQKTNSILMGEARVPRGLWRRSDLPK